MSKKIFISLSFLLMFCFLTGSNVFSEEQYRDVVYLKNGGVVKGQIIENIINDKIKIQTSDGSVFVYKYTEIDKITKEKYIDETKSTKSALNRAQYEAEKKSQSTGCLWGFFIPGGQHYYVGNYATGVIYTASFAGLYVGMLLVSNADTAGTLGLIALIIRAADIIHGIYSIDAYNTELQKKYLLSNNANNVEFNFYTAPIYNLSHNTLYDTTYNVALTYKF